jgi:hypothetical protein
MSDQTVETTQEQQEPVQLQLSDLLLSAQVIQLASSRGAFKPEEFTQVGALYERIVTFLQTSGALKQAEAPAVPDAPAAE